MTSIFFIFYQKKAFLNYEKWFLFPLKSSFCSWDIEYFEYCSFSLFLFTVFRFKGSDRKRNFSNHVLQLKRKLISSFRPFFFFIILYINGDWVQKKIKLIFSWSLLKYLIFKSLLHALTVWGYLPKLRRVIVLVFSADFLHTFFRIFFFSLNSLSNEQVSLFGERDLKG